MKLVVPITSDEDILPLVRAGADEFYCGIFTDEFAEIMEFSVWNKRPALRMNFRSFDVMKHAVDLAHENGKKVFLTVNSIGYIEKHYIYLERIITKSYKLGIDGFIVSDIGMIKFINGLKLDCQLHISTTAVVYNSEAVQYFKELGATRIIFPRHIGINEMKAVIKKDNQIEYEIFMMNSRCPNEDGLCTIEHALNFKDKIHGCIFNRKFQIYDPNNGSNENESFCEYIEHACGACIIPELVNSPIEYLKIVGRERPLRERVKDSIFLKRVINHLDDLDANAQEKIKNMYNAIYQQNCSGNCYYPLEREI